MNEAQQYGGGEAELNEKEPDFQAHKHEPHEASEAKREEEEPDFQAHKHEPHEAS
jgi:hypothetical protein